MKKWLILFIICLDWSLMWIDFTFVITSALAGISQNTASLIAYRVGQGIGIAMVVPITTALVYLT